LSTESSLSFRNFSARLRNSLKTAKRPLKLSRITAQQLKKVTKLKSKRKKDKSLALNRKFLSSCPNKSLIRLLSSILLKSKLDSSKIYPMPTMSTKLLPLLSIKTKIITTT